MIYDILSYLKTNDSIADSPENRPETTFGSVFVSRFLVEFRVRWCVAVIVLNIGYKALLLNKLQLLSGCSLRKHKVLFSIPVPSF